MTLEQFASQYVGKTLVGAEHGMNEPGCQTVTVPQKVVGVNFDVMYGDPCIFLTLENGEIAHFFMDEEIYFED